MSFGIFQSHKEKLMFCQNSLMSYYFFMEETEFLFFWNPYFPLLLSRTIEWVSAQTSRIQTTHPKLGSLKNCWAYWLVNTSKMGSFTEGFERPPCSGDQEHMKMCKGSATPKMRRCSRFFSGGGDLENRNASCLHLWQRTSGVATTKE